MAKLKARGRTELFRVERERTFTPEQVAANKAAGRSETLWERSVKTLMSDGTVMEKRSAKWPDEYGPGGVRKYDWEWKITGKLKAGGDPKNLLDQYVAKGYRVVSTGFALTSFDVAAYGAAESVRKTNVEKGRVRRAEAEKKATAPGGKNGPGFYVTNEGTSAFGKRIANYGPFGMGDLEKAIAKADEVFQGYVEMRFDYLLPVRVIEAVTRHDAERNHGHVWWSDGKRHGAPVAHAGQPPLPGFDGGTV
jgi:hypothetical protein